MSAVREAIEALLRRWDDIGVDLNAQHIDDLAADLAAAVEAVPVKVTIRELSMVDNENVVTIKDREAQIYLRNLVSAAVAEYDDLHLTVDNGYLKAKVGGFTWSVPIPTEVYNP